MLAIKTLATAISLVCTTAAIAGDLNAPSAPTDSGSAMFTLEDVYNRMETGAAGVKRGSFEEPGSAPGGTGHTLDDAMGKAPAIEATDGAAIADVVTGKKYWGLKSDEWGLQTGTGGSIATGNATDADVLKDKTYSNASGGSTGSMPDKEGANASTGQSATAGVNSFTAPTGFYDGDDTVTATDAEVRVLDSDIAAGNIILGTEIFGVDGSALISVGTAAMSDVLAGKTFSNGTATNLSGGITILSPLTITPTTSDISIPGGYYSGPGSVAGDADLKAGNIKAGTDIFGVPGKPAVVDTTSGDAIAVNILKGKKAWVNGSEVTGNAYCSAYPALVPKTGQTICYDAAGTVISCTSTGQDADVLAGETWPTPRFHKNASGANDDGSGGGIAGDGICNGSETCNGSVTDNLTGLVWLENASCFGRQNWVTALASANGLADGVCGLSDGSKAHEWHLPNRVELISLIDSEYFTPALSNAAGTAKWAEGDAFSGVVSTNYWSSTTYAETTKSGWVVGFHNGRVNLTIKTRNYYVWPVRAGQ